MKSWVRSWEDGVAWRNCRFTAQRLNQAAANDVLKTRRMKQQDELLRRCGI